MKMGAMDILLYVDILLGLVYYYIAHNRRSGDKKPIDKAFQWLNGLLLLLVFLLVLLTGHKGDYAAVYQVLPVVFLIAEAVFYVRLFFSGKSGASQGDRIDRNENTGLHVGGRNTRRR